VREAFMSASEREVVLALVAAASQAVRWVGLDREGLLAWARRARWRRAWNGDGPLFDAITEDLGVRVNRAVIALRQRECVSVYANIITPTPALVERLARACARTPEET